MIIYFTKSKMTDTNPRWLDFSKKNLFFSNKDTFRNFLRVRSFHKNVHRWTISCVGSLIYFYPNSTLFFFYNSSGDL